MNFPEKFVWGASTASYQIEGAASEDGKGLSVWDMMTRWEGKIFEGNTGAVSCDHYHRYEEDVKLMKLIGLKGYRFSLSWPRILPEGMGEINEKGIAFYDRLVDSLLKNGIDPWVTLFHWDYPYALFCRGGWLNRDSADWFAEYTQVIVDKLSDRVTHWMTQNEPQCYLGLGHQDGWHAPGLKLDFPEVLLAAHHSLLAHGKAVQVIRARAKKRPLVGAAPVGVVSAPETDQPENIEAARKLMFSITKKDLWNNTWFADPMILGKYPEDGLELFKNDMVELKPGDMETICQPLDFYGANIYFAEFVRAGGESGYEFTKKKDGYPLTTMGWHVTPEALYWGPKFLFERYRLPIVITENGMADFEWVQLDGKVHDPKRIDFLTRYLREFKRAMDDGVDALGYFIWTLLDNFEWTYGYKQRFGLIYTDYQSKQRILKDSAYWYKKVIETNGAVLFDN